MKHAGVFTLGCEITDPAGRASIEVLAEQELQVEMVERQAELYQREDLRRCTVCGAAFASSSNSVKYCPDCRKRITRKQAAERMRKRRAHVTR